MPNRKEKIKPSIKKTIYEAALDQRGKPRGALAKELKDLIEGMGEISPNEYTLMKMISYARNNLIGADPLLDEPWNIGLSSKYNIPAKDIPLILEIQKLAKEIQGKTDNPLTLREAKWVSYLHPAISLLLESYDCDMPAAERLSYIYDWAYTYALRELVTEIPGSRVDTSDLDTRLTVDFRKWLLEKNQKRQVQK